MSARRHVIGSNPESPSNADIVQLVEHWICNPVMTVRFCLSALMEERMSTDKIIFICLMNMGIWFIVCCLGAYWGFDHTGSEKKITIGMIIMIFSMFMFCATPVLIPILR